MNVIKVLVVDDSAFMRKLITDFLNEDPMIEVVGTARNGADAIEKSKIYQPDVITMDVEMPVLNGIEALKTIMRADPKPVIMLSSTTKEGADNTILAMQYGAIDFIAKPSGAISLDLVKVKNEIINKVKHASQVNIQRVKTHYKTVVEIKKEPNVKSIISKKTLSTSWNSKNKKIVCIGTSTGGPRALQEVLTNLPESIDAPILVVQHMPAGFTKSLANRLNAMSKITVTEAADGDVLENGVAYIAPGDYHLMLDDHRTHVKIKLDRSEPRNGHRPSVDVMFESVSNLTNFDKIAVILTGMGSDGSKGLIELKNKGNVKAIAESQETCIVYGMPKSAIATEQVDTIKNLGNVASTIMNYME